MAECIICLTNICSRKSLKHIQTLLEFDLIEVLIQYIEGDKNPYGMVKSIDSLRIIYETFDGMSNNNKDESRLRDRCLIRLDGCNGLKAVEKLKDHPHQDIREAVSRFINKRFEYK